MREQPRRYRRGALESYALGHFPVLELLRHRPERAREVVVHPKLEGARRDGLERLAEVAGVPVREDEEMLARLAPKANIHALAVFEKYDQILSSVANHLLLYDPDNPGNVGSILRTAVALNCADVVLIGQRADPWNPHVIRASLGVCFLARCAVFPDLDAYRAAFGHAVYPFVLDGAVTLQEAEFTPPFALLFGPEWPGLPPEARALGPGVRIPIAPQVESLGLPVAVSMALYELARRG